MRAKLFGESRPRMYKIQVVWILWRGNGTGPKGSLQGWFRRKPPCAPKMEGKL
ncbi:hypothetical protein T11_8206, partial [Trichinella zimbabwensis]